MKSFTLALLAAALVVVPSSAQAQEAIDGQYIVVLKDDASTASADRAKTRARDRGGRIQRESFGRVLNGFSATLDSKALAAVKADAAVDFVEQDRVVRLNATQANATWGLDRLDQRDLPLSSTYSYDETGAGVKAYIIDTGIRLSHNDFGGRASSGYDAIDGGSADDCNGHGTHVAGTVGGSTYGVAKAVSLVAVRVLDCNGEGSTSGVIGGVNWVTTNHLAGQAAVANMSLGGGVSNALDTAVSNSIADGVTYALAAGNESTNACNSSPARTVAAITVGATTRTDARASFSNYGTCVDLFAPGNGITSAWYTSNTATNTISGTSMASPHVAGAAAVYLQGNPGANPATVANALVTDATTGKVTSPGTGSPNRLLYIQPPTGGTSPNPTPTPTPTVTPTPTTTPTPGTETRTGTLSGTGASSVQPDGTYYRSTTSGTHRASLTGPASADFDLALYKYNGASWTRVANSEGSTSTEQISYAGTAGYFYWRVTSWSGSGAFTLSWSRP